MTPKKQHIIAPKKSDVKKKNTDTNQNLKSSKTTTRKKLNEFGDSDSF